MCIAVPGRLVSIDGMDGVADCFGNLLNIMVGLVDVKVGDFVLIHAGCAIEVILMGQAEELASILMNYGVTE